MSSLTVRDMVGLSGGKAFASNALEKLLALFVMRRFAVVRRTRTVCNRSDMVAVDE